MKWDETSYVAQSKQFSKRLKSRASLFTYKYVIVRGRKTDSNTVKANQIIETTHREMSLLIVPTLSHWAELLAVPYDSDVDVFILVWGITYKTKNRLSRYL